MAVFSPVSATRDFGHHLIYAGLVGMVTISAISLISRLIREGQKE